MGEGLIGMTKSVSKILQNSSTTSPSDIGTVISSVLLLYFIWVLDFDQIEHDRFGTIRQQIWAILHFPLHVCILLTVEGSTALILWNIIVNTDKAWWSWYPVDLAETGESINNFGTYYGGPEETAQWLEYAVGNISTYFRPGSPEEEYNFEKNFTSILDLQEKQDTVFVTEERNEKAGEIVSEMWIAIENFIFENFGLEAPENRHRKGGQQGAGNEVSKNDSLWIVFSTVFVYFYIAAGTFLVVLAGMYWFGKTRKSKGEWASIAVRVFAGAGITFMTLAQYYSATAYSSGNFLYGSAWLIPVVMLGYSVVIILDNLLVWHTNKTIATQTSNTRNSFVGVADGSGGYGKTTHSGSSDEGPRIIERSNDEHV